MVEYKSAIPGEQRSATVVTLGNNKLIYLAANSTGKKPYLLGFPEEPYTPLCHHFHVSCVQINGVPEIR